MLNEACRGEEGAHPHRLFFSSLNVENLIGRSWPKLREEMQKIGVTAVEESGSSAQNQCEYRQTTWSNAGCSDELSLMTMANG
jgi:hypothetical protein